MKGFDKPPQNRRGKSNRRTPIDLFLLLCWLLLPIWSALAQETLEAQGIRFRLVPGGWYFVGSPPNETGRYADEAASRKVNLKPFYISVTEITNAQYGRFLKATGHKKPLYWEDQNLNGPNHPVVGVTWHDAAAFCRWLTTTWNDGREYRLLSEAEWQLAAAGKDHRVYAWGNDEEPNRCNCNEGENQIGRTSAVGIFARGQTPDGIHDLSGNVWEWCHDMEGSYRVLRGGGWISFAGVCRSAYRCGNEPGRRSNDFGFRLARGQKNKGKEQTR